MNSCDHMWTNARLASLAPTKPGLGLIEDGLIAVKDGLILYAGARAEAPAFSADHITDCEGRWITPGLIDCHTHLVYAGNRSEEWALRLSGTSYEALAKSGGGILSTVRATRLASEEELVTQSLPRLDALISEGVTTVEIKSGYGLSLDHEQKQLRAIQSLGQRRNIDIYATCLAAHALPPEFTDRKDAYIDYILATLLPEVAKANLAQSVDGFCETVGFSKDQIARLFQGALQQGFSIRLHAEQLSNQHGAEMAAGLGALSVDHLEHLDLDGIAAMARSGTVATLLPGAFYCLKETKLPPIEALRKAKVPIAIATDCNPGTAPLTSLLLTLNMGAVLFGLSLEECLAGVTREAARALGRLDHIGTLEAGKICHLAIWEIENLSDLVYRLGFNPLYQRVWRGRTS